MNIKKLKVLYQRISKHSHYQILPNCINKYINANNLTIQSRFEKERMELLKKQIDFRGKTVLDVGGNTGYFTFETIEAGARQVDYFEGNRNHSKFVKFIAEDLQFNINVFNNYLNFENDLEINQNTNITLLLNVLHHLGDDFGDQTISMKNAKILMANSINYFVGKTEYLVLQLGFCWKGDRNLLLFENGTKKEMIDFIEKATIDNWKIQAIGIAEEVNGQTIYNLLNKNNINRNDALGEFRNRPIFILKAIHE